MGGVYGQWGVSRRVNEGINRTLRSMGIRKITEGGQLDCLVNEGVFNGVNGGVSVEVGCLWQQVHQWGFIRTVDHPKFLVSLSPFPFPPEVKCRLRRCR